MLNSLTLLATSTAGNGSWSIGNFLQNSTTTLKTWGGYFIVLMGVVMVIAAVWQAAKGLMSGGRSDVNWFIVIALLILGGAFMVGGFSFVETIASGGRATIDELGGGGTILFNSFLQ